MMGHNLTEAEIISKGTAAMVKAMDGRWFGDGSMPQHRMGMLEIPAAPVDERMKRAVGSMKANRPVGTANRSESESRI